MQQHKTELRRRIIHRLQLAAYADPTGRRSAALRALLVTLLAVEESLYIGIYAPLPHEVNLMPLLHDYPQHRFGFPRCGKGHSMTFHHVITPEQELRPGAMGILAPLPELPIILPQQMDIMIVPGVGFTLSGQRLGYGGGYYDRYLPMCTQAHILALAFPEQIEGSLPTDEHDFPIPTVLTNGI